jgi:acetoin utilization protein AcuB
MRLQDIMNRSVETVAPTDTLVFANELMWRKQIHHLVVTEGSKVVGVISDTDLGGPDAGEIPDGLQVANRMSRELVTADPETTVDRAVNIFRERNLHCLPVLDGEKLVGIVTASDVMNLIKQGVSNRPSQGGSTGPYPPLQRLRENP